MNKKKENTNTYRKESAYNKEGNIKSINAHFRKNIIGFIRLLLPILGVVIFGYMLYSILSIWNPLFGVIFFIIISTIGMIILFTNDFLRKQDSLLIFLVNLGMVIVITVLLFAMAYSMKATSGHYMMDLGVPKTLTFFEAVYYSAITMVTGKVDISPHGYFRVFTMVQSLLGYLYLGLFVAGLTNIYHIKGNNDK